MSLFSSVILPRLEKELIAMEPEIAQLILRQAQDIGSEILSWITQKIEPKEIEILQ